MRCPRLVMHLHLPLENQLGVKDRLFKQDGGVLLLSPKLSSSTHQLKFSRL